MTVSPAEVEASYAACRRLCRRAKSNFPASFFLLPRASAARWTPCTPSCVTPTIWSNDPAAAAPGDALAAWRSAVEAALRGDFAMPRMTTCLDGALLPAIADAVARFGIPPGHLRAVLDGVEMDLVPPRYETFADLVAYCERVASAVGLACIHVWGFRGPEAFAFGRAAGIAMQLTNILRDVKEDARLGRIYLPAEDLRQCGYSAGAIQRGQTGEAFRRLMELEIGRAREHYAQGTRLLDWLHPPGQRVFGMMTATYRALLEEIARRPEDVFRRRIRVSRTRKLRIAARWGCCRRGGLHGRHERHRLLRDFRPTLASRRRGRRGLGGNRRRGGRCGTGMPRRTVRTGRRAGRTGRQLPRSGGRPTRRLLSTPGDGLLHQPAGPLPADGHARRSPPLPDAPFLRSRRAAEQLLRRRLASCPLAPPARPVAAKAPRPGRPLGILRAMRQLVASPPTGGTGRPTNQ